MSDATAPAPAPAGDDYAALLAAAQRLYHQAPAEAARLASQALAAAGDSATAEQHATVAKVRGYALALAGQYGASLIELHAGLAALPAGNSLLRVDLTRALSATHEQMNDLAEALSWASQSAALARELGDAGRLADALLSVGVVRSRRGDHAGGLEHYSQARQAYADSGEQALEAGALCNMGIACKNLGRADEAVQHLQQAVALSETVGAPALAAGPLSNMIEPLRLLGRMDDALATAARVLDLLGADGTPDMRAQALLQRGQTWQALGDLDAALQDMQAVLALVQDGGGRHVAPTHLALSRLYKLRGQFAQALDHHEAFHAADRRLLDETSARALNALQVRFDLERAQHDAQVQRLEAERLAALSRTDALTGCANRRRLDEHLDAAFASARRRSRPLTVAMVDIDDFKRINDAFGHTTGDAVLRGVAQCLLAHCRSVDLVARYGGEEFCIVFDEVDAAHAERACEAARDAVEHHDWSALHPALRVTLSIGLADHPALDSPLALLADADAQLYAAKRAGKNRVLRAA